MTDPHLSDLMPAVARGEAAWSPIQRAHLDACEGCTAEWRVVATAAHSRTAVPLLDLDALSRGVVLGTRADPGVVPLRPGRARFRWAIGLAAAATVVLAVALWQRGPASPDVALVPARQPTLLPELDGLLEGELQVILASYEQDDAAEQPLGAVPRLGDLTDAELERLMEEVEG